ncbi:MAG: MOSC domain-containing protein [Phycisphaerales bacterium]|nr:MOSC domain-containing protein [Phycisphaerales bacterium]
MNTAAGRVHQVSVSSGGVPKLPVPLARITRAGVEGDSQNDTKHHGGPDRAVCLFSLEVIQRLRAEGHPIRPGTAGENLTTEGLEWSRITPGARLRIVAAADGAHTELEVVSYTRPCSTIRDSFMDLKHNRIFQDAHPGESRVYARVLREGTVRVGDSIEII